MPRLLENASATGDWMIWTGGQGVFRVGGTFGGATVTLQAKAPDGTEFDVGPDTTLTAVGGAAFLLDNCQIRAEVTGGTPSGIYANAEPAR